MGFGLIALLLAGLALMMFRKRSAAQAVRTGAARSGHAYGTSAPGSGSSAAGATSSTAVAGAAAAGGDRDVQQLVANARAFYTLLQDLNNRGDLAGLRARTTDDIFPALAADIQARTQPSMTTVLSVEAQLVDATREVDRLVASVRFRSTVSEGPDQPPQSVDEVWHFVKDAAAPGAWRLAGIEQV